MIFYFNKKIYIFFSFVSFVVGILFFLTQYDHLVVHWATRVVVFDKKDLSVQCSINYKICRYFMWRDNKMIHESSEVLWLTNDNAANCKTVLGGWLTSLQDNRVLNRSVQLISVAMSAFNEQAYIAFSRSLFSSDWSIEQKWRVMESLLKTVRDAGVNMQEVFILVDDDYLVDDHLDFSHGWPINGYQQD